MSSVLWIRSPETSDSLLSKHGATDRTSVSVTAVKTTDQAAQVLRSEPFDSILCEVDGPADGDLDVVSRLREIDSQPPIVLYTTRHNPTVATLATRADIAEYAPLSVLADRGESLLDRAVAVSERADRNPSDVSQDDPTPQLQGDDAFGLHMFEALFSSSLSVKAVLSPDGTIRRVNEAMVGEEHDSQDLVGTRLEETDWWAATDAMRATLGTWIDRAAGGEDVRFAGDHYTEDGEKVAFDGALYPAALNSDLID